MAIAASGLFAQQDKPEGKPPGAILIDLAYAMQQPEGDLKQTFNFNFNLGSRISYLSPDNWIFGINGEWLFSDNIKIDVLAPLRASSGELVELTGKSGLTQQGQRGMLFTAHVGRLIPLQKNTRRHNLEFRLGAGYLQHWVRIRLLGRPEDLPQLFGEYKKGYDRRTAGLALQQYAGYRYISKNRLVNLFIGLDFTEGFTYNQRYYNFDTREVDDKMHTDLLLGFRAGFTIPFFIYTQNTRTDNIEFY